MKSFQKKYSELLSLAELYLFQEHQASDWVLSDSECYSFFKAFARSMHSQRIPHRPKPEIPDPPPMKSAKPALFSKEKQIKPNAGSSPSPANFPKKISERDDLKKNAETHEKPPSPEQTNRREHLSAKKPLQDPPKQSTIPPVGANHFKELLKIHPHVAWIEFPPSDLRAKQVSQKWEEKQNAFDALLISDCRQPEKHAFLIKIASAIKKYGKSAAILDIADPGLQSPPLSKIVIASRLLLSTHPEIKPHFEKSSVLIEIASISDMMQSQDLKRNLWDQITKYLQIAG